MTKVRFSAYRWWVALFAILSPHALGADAGTDARRVGFSPSNTYSEDHGHDDDTLKHGVSREHFKSDVSTYLENPTDSSFQHLLKTHPEALARHANRRIATGETLEDLVSDKSPKSILKPSAPGRVKDAYVPLPPDSARGAVGQRATFPKDRTQRIAAMPESDQRRKKEEALQPFRYWRSVGKQLQAGDTVKTIEAPHQDRADKTILQTDFRDWQAYNRQSQQQGGHLPQTPLLRLQIDDLHEHPDTGNPPLRNKWTKDTPERRQQTVKNWSSFYDIPSSPTSDIESGYASDASQLSTGRDTPSS